MKQAAISALLLPLCIFQPLAVHAETAPSYRDRLLSLHQSIVEIPSIYGGEAEVGNFLIDYLSEQGLATERQFLPSSERFNVLAWPQPRTSNYSRIIVTTHIDVVPPYFNYSRSGPDPPTAETVIAGRGTSDAKGAVAAQTLAVLELLSAGSITGDDVMLVFVVGEEVNGDGMLYFSAVMAERGTQPSVAIFGEPTNSTLACGHKGALACNIKVKGLSGHSGYPESGKSANEVLMRGLLKAIDTDLGKSELYGNTTINVGLMAGGIAANVIPDAANASLAIRVAIGPQDSGHTIVQDRLQEILTSVDPEAFTMECPFGFGVVDTNCDVEGFETDVMAYGTDIPRLQGNHSRYLYGPGDILKAHTADESITLGELESAVEGYKKLILHEIEPKNSTRR
ncbi:Zn-dependent exopeptidase [Aaosphaeria arxii CBS 175.79]|uniref:Zn-dependent exopeptidase n=1 Tax=Aaosphaeria arxii CBS 175.79 TaxID=1450172 RepID=A0A6A5XDA0_9PLEO|nr:Zn-dependent exopeptidase [Aaosphaeria arxii CBS 175.79]KAF2010744.1 Zn-dependent exopeptidase [Aaosphaeria arxii CBS 175.79]